MLAVTTSFSLRGIDALPVSVELDVQRGLPSFSIVGLPDAAVREARERVRAALVNCGFEFPLKRITANLAPADERKAGPGLDLAIAAALLAASGEVSPERLAGWALTGELALDGGIRSVRGVLAMAEAVRASGMKGLVVPAADAPEAALVEGIEVVGMERVSQLRELCSGEWSPPPPEPLALGGPGAAAPDMADLRGQPHLRMALEVAAAGGHSLLMVGPPGAGKSMAARRLPSILPPLSREHMLEAARVASACDGTRADRLGQMPFRAPHHTISAAGLVGGGNPLRPGELTRAHRGVLFLDELCEFRRDTLEALREPLETGRVRISRAGASQELPCRFTLVAASNPCPCGRGDEDPACSCSPIASARYRSQLSGALADRIDMIASVRQPLAEEMAGPPGEASAAIRERVLAARCRAAERHGAPVPNAEAPAELVAAAPFAEDARVLMSEAHARLGLSGRSHDRVLRLARTVADLEGEEEVSAAHLAQALQLRRRRGD